jgi:hypothetical protein
VGLKKQKQSNTFYFYSSFLSILTDISQNSYRMSENGVKSGVEPGDRVAIGITFGNSNSSIAFTVDDKAEVIANEDGGMFLCSLDGYRRDLGPIA